MLVLDHVELVVVVPSQLDGKLQTVQAVLDGALVGASTHGGVAIRRELVVVRLKDLPGVLGRPLEDDDHEGATPTVISASTSAVTVNTSETVSSAERVKNTEVANGEQTVTGGDSVGGGGGGTVGGGTVGGGTVGWT